MKQRLLHRRTFLLATISAALLGVIGIGTTVVASAGVSARAAATTIVTAWPADVTSLDPANLSTSEDHALTRNIYQTLLETKFSEQKDGSLKFVGADVMPGLAKSWTIGTDSITFHLRPNVEFYGTTDTVNAEDVKFSIDRIFATPGAGDLEANGLLSPNDVHIVDPMDVKIDFKTSAGTPTPVTPTIMAIFDQFFTGIVDETQVKPHETASDPTGANWLRSHAAGTGPYYIASRTPGVSFTLQAVPNSWAPPPSYPTVDIKITTASISSLLQSGAINVGEYGMTNVQLDSLQKAGLSVLWQNTGNFDMFAITSAPSNQVGALANVDVRKAIAYVLPYDSILKNIVHGRGSRDLSIVSPSAPEYTPAWSIYSTDLTKAKALMAAAGNPSINVPLHYLGSDTDQTNTAILIQASLKQIGINATLTPETQAGLFNVVDARSTPAKDTAIGPPGLELFNWSAWTDDPKIVIGYWATTGGINNYSLWSSPIVDKENTDYALKPTSAARTAAYKNAQKIIAEGAAVIPIVLTGAVAVEAKGIAGISFSPGGSGRYWTLHPTGVASPLDKIFE
jgi:peptide/nickel transport system substrate-binding protein